MYKIISPKTLYPKSKCSCCGKTEYLQEYNEESEVAQLAIKEGLCYHCAFWKHTLSNLTEHHLVVFGYLFAVYPRANRPYNKLLAGFGKERYFAMIDTKQLVISNNVWNIGKIPIQFQKNHPNTAYELSLYDWNSFRNNPFECELKGCYDRYRCLHYKLSIEKEKGGWNKVPKGYKIGTEECPSFIDIESHKPL